MQTSAAGTDFIESKEGVVLKAYRDVVGVLTIGAGLTKGSGVITPKPGMVITREEASRLLALSLRRNYEPRVTKALGSRVRQHVFDGAVSFDYNTGAIHRASWVKSLLAGDKINTRKRLMLWVKGGGRVLPGLSRRRAEEADIILLNEWPANITVARTPQKANVAFAGIAISLTSEEIKEIASAFRSLGFDPGEDVGKIRLDAVANFQRKYDLTVDGLIGKATLSTLQRELNAKRSVKQGAGGAAGGAVVAGGGEAASPTSIPDASGIDPWIITWAGVIGAALATAFLLYLAWHYRDLVAARVQSVAPRLARWLRSF